MNRLAFLSLTALFCCFVGLPFGTRTVAAAPLRLSEFPMDIQAAAACDVCNHVVTNSLLQVSNMMQAKKYPDITPLEVDEVMQHICDPYSPGGAWVRRLALLVLPGETPDDGTSTKTNSDAVHFETRVLKQFTKCKRSCLTVQSVCETMTEAVYFDDYPNKLITQAHIAPLLMDENAQNVLRATVCYNFDVCIRKEKFTGDLNMILNRKDSRLREELVADKIEFIDPSQLDAEMLVYESQKRNNVEMFTKEEMERLFKAISANDREAAAAIDSKIDRLTTAEFAEIRTLMLDERLKLDKEQQQLQRKQEVEEYKKKVGEIVEDTDDDYYVDDETDL